MSGDGFEATSAVIGGIAAVVTFVAVWIAAIGSVGWVFGIALGWIPAWIAAAIAYVFFRFLWPLLLLGVLAIIVLATGA